MRSIHHLLAAGDVAAAADIVAAVVAAHVDQGPGRDGAALAPRRSSDRQILAHKALTLTAGWVFTALDAG